MTTAEMLDVVDVIAQRVQTTTMTMSATLSAAFGCPFTGPVDPGRVEETAARVGAVGPAQIALADTIGVGIPRQVTYLVNRCRRAAPNSELRAHFHNARNTGSANAFAAIEAGVTTLDASIGGCPFAPDATGNIATDDLAYMLEQSGIATGLDLDELMNTARFVDELIEHQVPGNLSRAGNLGN